MVTESSHAPMKAMVWVGTRTDFSLFIHMSRETRRGQRPWRSKKEGLAGTLNKEPVVQVREDGVPETAYVCGYDGEDFGEDLWSHHYAERQDPELIVAKSNSESETFSMSRVVINVETSIFHVESCEPGSAGKGWDNR